MFGRDREVIATYKRETGERLKTLETGLRVLDRQREKPNPELVHDLFRATHSIKAGANLLGLKPVEALAHLMESILHHFRTGALAPDATNTLALQDGVDAIRILIDNTELSHTFNIEPELRRLAQALETAAA